MGEFAAYVVVQDLLAFDVRAFDPGAPIIQDATDVDAPVITPGDPAFFSSLLGGPSGIRQAFLGTSSNYALVGQGAFVDLAYLVDRGQFTPETAYNEEVYNNNLSDTADMSNFLDAGDSNGAMGRMSAFSGLPSFREIFAPTGDGILNAGNNESRFWPSVVDQFSSELAGSLRVGVMPNAAGTGTISDPGVIAYDSWTTAFEHDGISQDDDDNDGILDLPGSPDTDELIDEGRDGVDSFFAADPVTTPPRNGVDDAEEAESPPPYPAPLRGLEVRIRMWDVSTGQVRQVSVVGDFTN